MEQLLQALLAGIICGFVVSIPVGPVNLTVVNLALQRGFLRAFLAGLGAVAAETLYATVLMTGHTAILNKPAVAITLRITAVAVLAFVGIRSLLFREENFEARDEAKVEHVDQRWHHPRSFLLGFILTISNIMLVVLWAGISDALFAHEWITEKWPSRAMCSAGVLAGDTLWHFLLAFSVSRAHHRVKPRVLTVLVRICGAIFLASAFLLAYKSYLFLLAYLFPHD